MSELISRLLMCTCTFFLPAEPGSLSLKRWWGAGTCTWPAAPLDFTLTLAAALMELLDPPLPPLPAEAEPLWYMTQDTRVTAAKD